MMPPEIACAARSCAVPFLLLFGVLLSAEGGWSQSIGEFAHSYAVVVGIHSYGSRQWPDLPYGRTDAEAMVNYLKSQGFEVAPLLDSQATKHNVIETIVKLAGRLGPDDRVLFYFSGHGAIERNGDETWGYAVPYGATDVADYVSNTDIQDFSRRMKTARHQLFIFNSCFSGQMITRSGGVDPSLPSYIGEVTKRIAREGLAAGGRDQSVLDTGPNGQSVFTAALLKGLNCKADLNGDGFITFAELESYITPLATNSYQTPSASVLPGHEGGEFVFRSPCGRIGPAPNPEPLPKIVVKRGDTNQVAEAKRLLRNSQFAQALPLLQASAAAGDAEGMNNLGDLYISGWGVARDYAQARQLYEKAAAAGSTDAMYSFGWFYLNGQGVARDYTLARQLFEKAAAAGNTNAMSSLGWLYQNGHGVARDYAQARQLYEKAAAAGNPTAMNNLGAMYDDGSGVKKDRRQAQVWYEIAALAGDADAMNRLGSMYDDGRGVVRDYKLARDWYEKAAAAGSATAMFNLGYMYGHGNGVPKDSQQARQWYAKAAAAGDNDAAKELKKLPK